MPKPLDPRTVAYVRQHWADADGAYPTGYNRYDGELDERLTRLHGVPQVWRWSSNDQVPPADCLQAAHELAYITADDLKVSLAYGKLQTARFIEQYRQNQGPATEEDKAEMRAAFGPDEVVVDIITGRRTQL